MHRSRATVLRILDRISQQNQLLRSDSSAQPPPERLNEVLEAVARVCKHDALILIASDFDGADQRTRDLLLHLSRSNDVICCLTYDPLAVQAASGGAACGQQWRVAGGACSLGRRRCARAFSRPRTSACARFFRGSMSLECRCCPSARPKMWRSRCVICLARWQRCGDAYDRASRQAARLLPAAAAGMDSADHRLVCRCSPSPGLLLFG